MTTAVAAILNECEARLCNLKGANRGYHFQMKRVERARTTPFEPGDIPQANLYATGDRLLAKSHGFETRALSVVVEASAKTGDRPFIDVAAELVSDVVTALYRSTSAPKADDTPSHALGGLVDSVTNNGAEYLIGEGQKPWCAASIEIEITYKVRMGETALMA